MESTLGFGEEGMVMHIMCLVHCLVGRVYAPFPERGIKTE